MNGDSEMTKQLTEFQEKLGLVTTTE